MAESLDIPLADLLLSVIVVMTDQRRLSAEMVAALAEMAGTRPELQGTMAKLAEAARRVDESEDELMAKMEGYLRV